MEEISDKKGVPPLAEGDVNALKAHGMTISALSTLGAEVFGADLRSIRGDHPALTILQRIMSERGFIGALPVLCPVTASQT